MNLTDARQTVDEKLSAYKLSEQLLKEEQKALKLSEKELRTTEKAQVILQQVAQTVQQQAHTKITRVVSQCLKSVFYDEDYGFHIRFEQKRGKTEAKLLLINQGHEIEDPRNYDSGGVLDVASFALRLSCLLLARPKLRKVLVMDEPFKNVSVEYRDNVRVMLENLSKDFSVQIIMVTHETGFKCGKVVQL